MESLYLRGQKPCKSIGTKETVHIRPRLHYPEEIWKRSFSSPVRPTVHTDPSRKRRFSKTLLKRETFVNGGLREHFENDDSDYHVTSLPEFSSSTNPKWPVLRLWWSGRLENRQCNPCHLQYRVETKRRLKDRFNEHRRSVDKTNIKSKPTTVAEHFLSHPNHCHTDMQLIPIELIHSSRDSIRKARESSLIDLARTLEPHGMNRRDKS